MRFVVLKGDLINGSSEMKLVDAVTFSEEGGKPEDFFIPGLANKVVKLGEVDITIVEGDPSLDSIFPEVLTEGRE